MIKGHIFFVFFDHGTKINPGLECMHQTHIVSSLCVSNARFDQTVYYYFFMEQNSPWDVAFIFLHFMLFEFSVMDKKSSS